ncbi:hypothetical protein ACFPRL_10885 [Pseudoclavibacter helvolus]
MTSTRHVNAWTRRACSTMPTSSGSSERTELTARTAARPESRDGFHASRWVASHPQAWNPSRGC